MAYEIAKMLLEHADSFLSRQEAVKTALGMGMPLHEIEDYLEWLDLVKGPATPPDDGASDTPPAKQS